MSHCSGLNSACQIYINHPCVNPTLQIVCKSFVDEQGNAITTNVSAGYSTTITTTPSGETSVVHSDTVQSKTTTVPSPLKSRMTFAGEGKGFDTDSYYNAITTDEAFVDIREMMGLIAAEVSILAFLALATELVAAWLSDQQAMPNGLGVRAYLRAGDYGGEDPSNVATYRPNRGVSLERQVNSIDGVNTVLLYFKMIRGNKGKPGECRQQV